MKILISIGKCEHLLGLSFIYCSLEQTNELICVFNEKTKQQKHNRWYLFTQTECDNANIEQSQQCVTCFKKFGIDSFVWTETVTMYEQCTTKYEQKTTNGLQRTKNGHRLDYFLIQHQILVQITVSLFLCRMFHHLRQQ